MLVLSRKSDQEILIGSGIVLTVLAVKGNRVTLGIEAPRNVRIQRSELVETDSCCLEPSDTILTDGISIAAVEMETCIAG